MKYNSNLTIYGSHQAISEFVVENSRVLDVGCASGYLIDFLINHRSCKGVGIEPNLTDYQEAAARGLNVLNLPAIEAFETLSDQGSKFEHIIFGDVLEHMVNPEDCIAACLELLAHDGTIIISLPNVVSLVARLRILFGIWRYEDDGIFDSTHLRFFNVKSGKKLLEDSGLTIITSLYVGPLTYRFGKHLLKINKILPNLLANQMVFQAQLTRSV